MLRLKIVHELHISTHSLGELFAQLSQPLRHAVLALRHHSLGTGDHGCEIVELRQGVPPELLQPPDTLLVLVQPRRQAQGPLEPRDPLNQGVLVVLLGLEKLNFAQCQRVRLTHLTQSLLKILLNALDLSLHPDGRFREWFAKAAVLLTLLDQVVQILPLERLAGFEPHHFALHLEHPLRQIALIGKHLLELARLLAG